MCRMIALRGDPDAIQAFLQTDVLADFQSRCRRHRAGWGLAWYEFGQPRLDHHGEWICESAGFQSRIRRLRSHLVIIHARRATRGGVRAENIHPFATDRWIFAHNGTILDAVTEEIRRRINPPTRGTTDSEVYFHHLLEALGRSQSAELAIAEAVAWITERSRTARLNFVLSDGTRLFAYRQGHSLYSFALSGLDGVSSYALVPGWRAVRPKELLAFSGPLGNAEIHSAGGGRRMAATSPRTPEGPL